MPRKLPLLVVAAPLAAALLLSLPARGQDADTELLLDVAQKKVRALDFQADTLDGGAVRLRELRGRVVFLNFWATWCVPCRTEMPAMERLHNKLRNRPFTMLAVNIEEPPVLVRKFVEDLGLTFTIVMDRDGEISETYRAHNLPLTYIIDRKGFVSRRAIGAREWDTPAALRLMERLMAEEG